MRTTNEYISGRRKLNQKGYYEMQVIMVNYFFKKVNMDTSKCALCKTTNIITTNFGGIKRKRYENSGQQTTASFRR